MFHFLSYDDFSYKLIFLDDNKLLENKKSFSKDISSKR